VIILRNNRGSCFPPVFGQTGEMSISSPPPPSLNGLHFASLLLFYAFHPTCSNSTSANTEPGWITPLPIPLATPYRSFSLLPYLWSTRRTCLNAFKSESVFSPLKYDSWNWNLGIFSLFLRSTSFSCLRPGNECSLLFSFGPGGLTLTDFFNFFFYILLLVFFYIAQSLKIPVVSKDIPRCFHSWYPFRANSAVVGVSVARRPFLPPSSTSSALVLILSKLRGRW